MSSSRRPSAALSAAGLVLVAAGAVASAACSAAPERTPFEPASPPTASTDASADGAPRRETQPRPVETQPTADAGPTEAPPDCPGLASGVACGVAPQCGCATTETCDLVDQDGTADCLPAGRFAMGAPCTATQGCARGLTCVFGTCHAFCASAGSACGLPGTGACVQVAGAGGAPIPGFSVCRVACDLRDPSACGGTNAAGTGVCITDGAGGTECISGGSRKVNEPCSAEDDCGPSLVCVLTGSASVGTCRRWCRVGQSDCGSGVTCGSFTPTVLVGTVEYGACP